MGHKVVEEIEGLPAEVERMASVLDSKAEEDFEAASEVVPCHLAGVCSDSSHSALEVRTNLEVESLIFAMPKTFESS